MVIKMEKRYMSSIVATMIVLSCFSVSAEIGACDNTAPWLRGDANNDGKINIGDATYILAYLFQGGPAPHSGCFESINVNGDASASITDAIYLLNFLFLGGPEPASPRSSQSAYCKDGESAAPGKPELFAGCTGKYSESTCSESNKIEFVGDRCAPSGGLAVSKTLIEVQCAEDNADCQKGAPKEPRINCEDFCKGNEPDNTDGYCETVKNACGNGKDSARCVCIKSNQEFYSDAYTCKDADGLDPNTPGCTTSYKDPNERLLSCTNSIQTVYDECIIQSPSLGSYDLLEKACIRSSSATEPASRYCPDANTHENTESCCYNQNSQVIIETQAYLCKDVCIERCIKEKIASESRCKGSYTGVCRNFPPEDKKGVCPETATKSAKPEDKRSAKCVCSWIISPSS